jgi:hypothetical protein
MKWGGNPIAAIDETHRLPRYPIILLKQLAPSSLQGTWIEQSVGISYPALYPFIPI